jgi:sulfite reductase alpha subunit-like flavoprotein
VKRWLSVWGTTRPSYGYTAKSIDTLDSAVNRLRKPFDEVVVVVTFSYDGFSADNAVNFRIWLKTLGCDALDGMRYAVFACDTYACKLPILAA